MAPKIISLVCPTCKKRFERSKSYVRKSRAAGYKRFFCSILCRNNMASKNKPMRGARYRRINVNGKCVEIHRHMMEIHLGRRLLRSEEVHHKNEDKEDNRIENLELMTKAQHTSHHGFSRVTFNIERAKTLREKGWSFKRIAHAVRRDPSSVHAALVSRGWHTIKHRQVR